MGKRSWMGSSVRVNDNGIAVDPAALRSIMDPKHTLHDRRGEVRRIHEPLLEAVQPVLRAYSDGVISLSRAAKIAKMPHAKQEAAISEPAPAKTPKPKRAMFDASKVPVAALKAAALKAGERGSGPITDWLSSIGATDDAG